jgi:hypothetical protein
LEILYGRGDADLAQRFLERCLLIAERAFAEDKLQSPRCRNSFPENRGQLLRVRAYAQAILGGLLEEADLLKASADYEQVTASYPKHKWDDLQEDTYMTVVRLALLASDRERVQRLLTRRRAFRWRPEEHDLWTSLLPLNETRARDEALEARFKMYFDRIRDPNFKPEGFMQRDFVRLELGMLWDKYFVSPDRQIDWQRTIDAIAE